MRRMLTTTVCMSVLGVAGVAAGQCQPDNRGFETGDFSDWQVAGRAAIVGVFGFVNEPTDDFQAFLSTRGTGASGSATGTPLPAADLEAFLGVAPGTLAAVLADQGGATPNGPTTGSAIRTSGTVVAGSTISFDWNFIASEVAPPNYFPSSTFNDFVFVTISSGGTTLVADTYTTGFSTAFAEFSGGSQTGVRSFSFVSPVGGEIDVAIGVMGVGTSSDGSAVLIDNVCIEDPCAANQPPTCVADFTAADETFGTEVSGSFIVSDGQTLEIDLVGADPNVDQELIAAVDGLPGATLAPSDDDPTVTILSWTPSAADKAGAPYSATVTFTDPCGAVASCAFTVEDVNLNPVCTVVGGFDQTFECESSLGALVTLVGGATDEDDPDETLMYHWDLSTYQLDLSESESPVLSVEFPIGVTTATLTVLDGRGGSSVCEVFVRVEDTMPPLVECTTSKRRLRAWRHRMRPVEIVVRATDLCDDPEFLFPILVTISSDEPDNAPGWYDGNTTGDVNGEDGYTAPVDVTSSLSWNEEEQAYVGTVQLRAERAWCSDGRKYTVRALAFDAAGNMAETSCVVVVPHRRRWWGGWW